jgi:hypothetical protein
MILSQERVSRCISRTRHAPPIDRRSALLDEPSCRALRRNEAERYEAVHDILELLDLDERNLAAESYQCLNGQGSRITPGEEKLRDVFGNPRGIVAMYARSDFASQGLLGFALLRPRFDRLLELGYRFAGQQGEEPQISACVTVVDVSPELVELVG